MTMGEAAGRTAGAATAETADAAATAPPRVGVDVEFAVFEMDDASTDGRIFCWMGRVPVGPSLVRGAMVICEEERVLLATARERGDESESVAFAVCRPAADGWRNAERVELKLGGWAAAVATATSTVGASGGGDSDVAAR